MKTLFTITLVLELLLGIGFIAIHGTLADTFGVILGDFGIALGRLFGSALLGFAVLPWVGRKISTPEIHKALPSSMPTY
jgi:hypothetical protein